MVVSSKPRDKEPPKKRVGLEDRLAFHWSDQNHTTLCHSFQLSQNAIPSVRGDMFQEVATDYPVKSAIYKRQILRVARSEPRAILPLQIGHRDRSRWEKVGQWATRPSHFEDSRFLTCIVEDIHDFRDEAIPLVQIEGQPVQIPLDLNGEDFHLDSFGLKSRPFAYRKPQNAPTGGQVERLPLMEGGTLLGAEVTQAQISNRCVRMAFATRVNGEPTACRPLSRV